MYQIKNPIWKRYLLILLIFSVVSLIIQSPQIFSKGYILGVDSIFHMNRIYETMMQIKTGEFNYFLSLFSYQQSARIVNAFYGPGMSYLLGGILLLLGSWVKFQIVTSFLINVIGAFGVYRIAKKLNTGDALAVFSGIIYMSTYFVASWNIAGSFTGVGNMLIPYVLYYGIEMIVSKENKFSIIGLGFSMGILLQTHVFSSLLATLALFPFVIYVLISTKDKWRFIVKLFLSVLVAILLSLNVWLGMFHLMTENKLLQTVPLDLFKNAVFFSIENGDSQADLGIVLSILFLFQIFQTILSWKKINHFSKLIVVTGSIFLFFSTRFFPWGILSRMIPALESYIQFPSRFIIVPTIFLIVSLGLTAKHLKQKNIIILVGICACFSVSFAQNRVVNRMNEWSSENVLASPNKKPQNISDVELRNSIKNQNLGEILAIVKKGTSDYLPIRDKIDNKDFEEFGSYSKYWEYVIYPENDFKKSVENGKLIVSWESPVEENTKIPIFKYASTKINNYSTEKEAAIETTDIGTIITQSKIGKNKLVISYQTPMVIWISIIISGIVFIVCLLVQLIRGFKSVFFEIL